MTSVARASHASALLDALPEAVALERPVRVDDLEIGVAVEPADGDALARCLATLERLGASAIVRGGGSRLALGNVPAHADAVLSTRALEGIETFDIGDGVVHVGAGTTLAALRDCVEQEGWALPLDAWGPDATVGGVVSAAACGPRLLGLGPARDAVLGLDVVLASGVRTRCGGRVVKNVTGYDLAKLYTGACGSLGVIERAWLRLHPRPEETIQLTARLTAGAGEPAGGGRDGATALALETSRRTSARCVALVAAGAAAHVDAADSGPGAASESDPRGSTLVAELAGDRATVEEDLDWLASRIDFEKADAGAIDRLAALQGGPSALRARLAVLPSGLAALARDLGESLLCHHPGTGLAFAGFAPGEEPSTAVLGRRLEAIDRAARGAAACVIEALPAAQKGGRDVFGAPGPEGRLMAGLKARFDPQRVLNPGRFQGRI